MKIKLLTLFTLFSLFANSQNFFEKGEEYFSKEDYKNAVISFTNAIENNQNLKLSYHNRGRAYYRLGDYANASKDAEKCCEMNFCVLLEYIKETGNYVSHTGDNTTEEVNSISDEEENKNITHSTPPTKAKNTDKMLKKAKELVKEEEYENAIVLLNEIIEIEPENLLAYKEKCKIYLLFDEYEKANEMAEIVCKLGDCKLKNYIENNQ